jgi:hypothetical protein
MMASTSVSQNHPAPTGLDRGSDAVLGNLTGKPTAGQLVAAGLPVVAGVWVHGGPDRQRVKRSEGV